MDELKTQFKGRKEMHAFRRAAHFIAGIFVLWLSTQVESKQEFVTGLALFSLGVLVIDLLRVQSTGLNSFLMKWLRAFIRDGEQGKLSGMPYYWWGITISYVVFPYPVASLAVLFLAVGDPAAALVGSFCRQRNWCWTLIEGKSWQGTIGAGLACGIATYSLAPFFLELDQVEIPLLHLALAGAVIGGIAELLPLRTDDNLSLPLVSGALLWIYFSSLNVILI